MILLPTSELPARLIKGISFGEPGECWLWTKSCYPDGYGQVGWRVENRWTTRAIHRVVYELLVGPVPTGLVLDHLCKVRRCCCPEHVEPVTQQTNVRRGDRWTLTHCLNGHDLLIHGYQRPDGTGRFCKTCNNERRRDRRMRVHQ